MILHANELGPAMLLGRKLHLRKLCGPHAARADVADLSGLDKVMQSLHGLFHWDSSVEAVDLEEVQIGSVEASESGLYSSEDGLTGETSIIVNIVKL